MPVMVVKLEGDSAWPELGPLVADGKVIHLGQGAPPIQVAGLEGGMTSGKASVCLRIDLPDGRTVIAETSLRCFLVAADALRARFEKPEGRDVRRN